MRETLLLGPQNDMLVYKEMMMYIVLIILCIGSAMKLLPYLYVKLQYRFKQGEIRRHLQEDDYMLFYQPIISCDTECIVGFEALIRQRSGESVVLTPDEFMDKIEDAKMMGEVSLWVLKRAIEAHSQMKQNCMQNQPFYISINISKRELEDERFIAALKEVVKNCPFEKNSICIELTEELSVGDLEALKKSMSDVKSYGFQIALDDFGVEYANLDLLEKLEFDMIKLDRFFVNNVSKSIIGREVLDFLSRLSKMTETALIIEGVETEAQRDIIRSINNENICIQGYYYSKPVAINKIEKGIFTYNKNRKYE